LKRRAALAFAAGAAAVLAFSPSDLWPVGLAALTLLIHLWLRAESPRAALLLGYSFGLGLFGATALAFGQRPSSWSSVSLVRWCSRSVRQDSEQK